MAKTVEVTIPWSKFLKTKQDLNQFLEQSDMNGWEIKELKLVPKGNPHIQNSCVVVRLPDGTIEIVC